MRRILIHLSGDGKLWRIIFLSIWLCSFYNILPLYTRLLSLVLHWESRHRISVFFLFNLLIMSQSLYKFFFFSFHEVNKSYWTYFLSIDEHFCFKKPLFVESARVCCILLLIGSSLLITIRLNWVFFLVLQKILWIGPVKFKFSGQCADGASKLAQALNDLRQRNCDITVAGNMACQAMVMESKSVLVNDMIENASVLWEFFKGRKLPGVMALDRVCSVNFTIYFLL